MNFPFAIVTFERTPWRGDVNKNSDALKASLQVWKDEQEDDLYNKSKEKQRRTGAGKERQQGCNPLRVT